jgi:Crp-like helix-turn-helix domain
MNVVVEIAPPEEAIDAMGWIKIPESEVETDENGIPTGKAAEYGFGLRDPETDEIIRLYPVHVEAMRAIASKFPFREFIEGYLDEIPNLKRGYLTLFDERRDYMEMVGIDREEFARDITSSNLREIYLLTLARMAKEYPRGPRGIIDFYRDRETRAARRFKKWMAEVLSRRLTNAHLLSLAALDVPGRVAFQLLALAREYGERTPGGTRIPMRLTQTDLASLVGASRVRMN